MFSDYFIKFLSDYLKYFFFSHWRELWNSCLTELLQMLHDTGLFWHTCNNLTKGNIFKGIINNLKNFLEQIGTKIYFCFLTKSWTPQLHRDRQPMNDWHWDYLLLKGSLGSVGQYPASENSTFYSWIITMQIFDYKLRLHCKSFQCRTLSLIA